MALAVIEWRGPERARIEVAGTAAGSARWVRQLEFLPGDAAEERWKAAGYAAGTLARELLTGPPPAGARGDVPGEPAPSPTSGAAPVASAEPTPAGPERERKPTAPDENAPDSERESIRAASVGGLWLDAGAWGGRGLWRDTLRLGGFARFSRAFDGPLVTASFGYATDGPDAVGLSGTWLTPSVGGGYAVPLSRRLTASVRCEIVAERLAVTARDASGRTDEANRWVGGARVGADLAFIAVGPLGLVLGGDVTARASQAHLELRNEVIGTIPLWDYSASVGLRAALP